MSDLEEREAIRRLMAIYAQLLDSKRIVEWGQLFTEDAVFAVWGMSWKGRESIVSGIGGMQPEAPGKHVILTPVIDFVAPDRALAWTDLSAFSSANVPSTSGSGGANPGVAAPGEISIATIGRYHDELVKQGGRWRIARRVCVMAGEALPDGVAPSPAW